MSRTNIVKGLYINANRFGNYVGNIIEVCHNRWLLAACLRGIFVNNYMPTNFGVHDDQVEIS